MSESSELKEFPKDYAYDFKMANVITPTTPSNPTALLCEISLVGRKGNEVLGCITVGTGVKLKSNTNAILSQAVVGVKYTASSFRVEYEGVGLTESNKFEEK